MSQATIVESANLFYRDARSDKVYSAAVEQVGGDEYIVTFAYGRRGASLTTGQKTPKPVSLDAATKVYNKLLAEKTGKGYQPGGDVATYVPADSFATAVMGQCQLLNAVERPEAEAMLSDATFATQLKMDGKRLQVGRREGAIFALNRKGQSCAFPKAIADAVAKVPGGDFLFDGEQVGEVYHAFDILQLDGDDLRSQSFFDRYATLVGIMLTTASAHCALVKAAFTTQQKQQMLADAEALNEEGIVFKRTAAPYTPGRPASGGDQFKLKFVTTCSARVSAQNGDKRSVSLELADDNGGWAGVGNVTVPANQTIPEAGQVVEVRYLYAYEGGSLFQPVLLGVRDDISADDCTIDQLKYKPAA
jgi:bifunctional non-homologous end joining protein LigD